MIVQSIRRIVSEKNSARRYRTFATGKIGGILAYGSVRPKRSGCIFTESFIFRRERCRERKQNSFFAKRFGRNDFEKIEDKNRLGDALAYIMKYIEKSGEKIVYSRGLAQFFISDVMDEDIVCLYGMEEQKFLLYDDFGCWNEGEYIGQVSRETIAKMPKAN